MQSCWQELRGRSWITGLDVSTLKLSAPAANSAVSASTVGILLPLDILARDVVCGLVSTSLTTPFTSIMKIIEIKE